MVVTSLLLIGKPEDRNLKQTVNSVLKKGRLLKRSCKKQHQLVSKRIKPKFFRGLENPHSGTIVDDVVTLPER